MDLLKKPGTSSRLSGTLLAGMIAGASMMTAAGAQDMRFAVGLPESNYNYDASVYFANKVAENSDMRVRVFALSLLNLSEIPGGIRDGLADFGYSLLPYFPAEFSELNLPANLSWIAATNPDARWPGPAMIGATTESVARYIREGQFG